MEQELLRECAELTVRVFRSEQTFLQSRGDEALEAELGSLRRNLEDFLRNNATPKYELYFRSSTEDHHVLARQVRSRFGHNPSLTVSGETSKIHITGEAQVLSDVEKFMNEICPGIRIEATGNPIYPNPFQTVSGALNFLSLQ